MSAPPAAAPGLRDRLVRLWLTNFWTAFAVLAALKIGLVVYNVASPQASGLDPAWKYALKALFVLGGDVLGAALLALAAAVLCLPLAWRGLGRAATAASIAIQLAHALFALASSLCTVYLGGLLNKQAIDLAAASAPAGEAAFGGGMARSASLYLDGWTIAAFVAVGAIAVGGVALAPRLYRKLVGRRRKIAIGALVAEAVITVGVLPWLVGGEIGGIRVPTYGLEKSPAVELGWSYLRGSLAARRLPRDLVRDEFRYDFAGSPTPGATTPSPLRRATPRRTNVVWVAMESVGEPYLRAEPGLMPFLRALGERADAHRLAEHYSTWSLTTKAFFSMFCSELPYPHYQSITMVNPAIPCRSLSEVLHAAGYRTAYVTSSDMAYDRKERFFRYRAFDEMWDMKNMPGREASWQDAWGLDERTAVRQLLDVAARDDDRPFFIFYEMVAGHHPFLACAEHEANPLPDRFDNYRRVLGFIDDRVREVAEGLARLGHADDTLLVVMADHGDGHGRYEGRNVWEPVIHPPVVLVGPQLAGAAGRTDFVTSHLDLAPTILGLVDLPVPCTMKGRNLLVDDAPRLALFGGRPPKFQLGVRDGKWKLIWQDEELAMLFDLQADPAEAHDLAGAHPELVDRYRRKIEEWSAFSTNLVENYAEILARSGCAP